MEPATVVAPNPSEGTRAVNLDVYPVAPPEASFVDHVGHDDGQANPDIVEMMGQFSQLLNTISGWMERQERREEAREKREEAREKREHAKEKREEEGESLDELIYL